MRDVVPPHDRSIRNIPLPVHRRRVTEEQLIAKESHIPPPPQDFDDERPQRPRRRRPIWLYITAAVLLGVLLAVPLLYAFEGATVEVVPKRLSVTQTAPFEARIEAPLGILPFETVTQTEVGSRTVPASGEAEVQRRASGTIVIRNAYGVEPQRLIKNTRFEAKNGKVYRVDNSVVVPGATKNADGTLRPGEIEATVFADSPGEDYNQGATTFTIPGFKGEARFEKFTAVSKSPLSGGFSGIEKVVSSTDADAAYKSIEAALSDVLKEMLQKATPEGYILIKDSERISFEELPRESGQGGGAVLSKRGTIVGAIVKSDVLASALLSQADSSLSGQAIRIEGAYPEVVARAPLSSDFKSPLYLSIAAPVTLVWQFDHEALKKALAGSPHSSLSSIVNETFSGALLSATVSMRPVWKNSFPKDTNDIEVKIAPNSQ